MPADGTLTAIWPRWLRQPLWQLISQYTPRAVCPEGLLGRRGIGGPRARATTMGPNEARGRTVGNETFVELWDPLIIQRPRLGTADRRPPSDPWDPSRSNRPWRPILRWTAGAMGLAQPNRASMGPDQQSWDFRGRNTRCRKPGSLVREVYWHFAKPLSRNSKNAMVSMRLLLSLCDGAANAF